MTQHLIAGRRKGAIGTAFLLAGALALLGACATVPGQPLVEPSSGTLSSSQAADGPQA